MDVILYGWCKGTAAACARALASQGDRVVWAVSGPGCEGALAAACSEIGAPLASVADPGSPELAGRVAGLGADLLLVAGWPRRIERHVLDATRLGAVNVHPSLLPRYRAREPLFWTVLSGDEESGVTLHRMTESIDAGPVLLQRALRVEAGSSSVTLGAQLDALAAELTRELCRRARGGTLPEASPQRGEPTHFPPVRAEHGHLCWSEPARALERRVRACAGIIEARATHRGMKIVILDASAVESSIDALPGMVLELRSEQMVIAAGAASALAVSRVGFLGRIESGAELAAALGLSPGARFDDG